MIVDLPFRIDTTGSTGFRTKIEGLKIRVCYDLENHSKLKDVKTACTMSECESKVDAMTLYPVIEPSSNFDTSEEAKNTLYNGEGRELAPAHKFINMVFDRYYYSQAADSLMKRIRVLNTSTIYNVSEPHLHPKNTCVRCV
jgi:hypothetical protein